MAADNPPPQPGLATSLRRLLATSLGLVQTRLALLGTELEEEKVRVVGMLAYGAAALLLLIIGLAFLAAFLTVLLWDSNRLLALGLFSALFLGFGGATLYLAVMFGRRKSRLFAASLAELNQDRAGLEREP